MAHAVDPSDSRFHFRAAAREKRACAEQSPERHTLRCLELWGGISAVDTALSVTGLDGWLWSQPADGDTGGDICLVSMCACARISRFLLGDVTGHGQPAAKLAKRLRRLMWRHINEPDQTRLARSLNDDFSRLAHDGKFATALLATFFPPTRQLVICNAGHPKPLWYCANLHRWQIIPTAAAPHGGPSRNLPFGIEPAIRYQQFALRLEPADLLLFVSDGVTEARNRRGVMLEQQGLLDLVCGCDPSSHETTMACLRTALRNYLANESFSDDATILLLRANGAQPPTRSLVQRLRARASMLGPRRWR